MTTEQNEAIVRRFYEALVANDEVALKEVVAPALVAYQNSIPGLQTREVHLEGIRTWHTTFSGTSFTIEEQGDSVATRATMRAVYSLGEFRGLAPTGKQVEINGISIERIKDGLIVARRVMSYWNGMMQNAWPHSVT